MEPVADLHRQADVHVGHTCRERTCAFRFGTQNCVPYRFSCMVVAVRPQCVTTTKIKEIKGEHTCIVRVSPRYSDDACRSPVDIMLVLFVFWNDDVRPPTTSCNHFVIFLRISGCDDLSGWFGRRQAPPLRVVSANGDVTEPEGISEHG